MKKNDKIKTMYGEIETVMIATKYQVITYESAQKNFWYHPSNVKAVK